jgi:hypothetical protein
MAQKKRKWSDVFMDEGRKRDGSKRVSATISAV